MPSTAPRERRQSPDSGGHEHRRSGVTVDSQRRSAHGLRSGWSLHQSGFAHGELGDAGDDCGE